MLEIQCYFDVNDAQGGLLQSIFIASYVVCAPLAGYLGDRRSRKVSRLTLIFLDSTSKCNPVCFLMNFHWFRLTHNES